MIIERIGKNGNIIKCSADADVVAHPQGLGVLIMEKMTEYSNNIAQIHAESGEKLTYGEVLIECIRVAQNLQKRNICPDDIIVLSSFNNKECVFPYIASLFLGNRISAFDPTLPKNDFSYLLNRVKPRYVFCDESCVNAIKEVVEELKLNTEIFLYGDKKIATCIQFSELRKSTGSEKTFKAKPVENIFDTAFVLFSSGSTGPAKAICGTHYAVNVQQELLRRSCDCSVVLYFSTFYWVSATMLLVASILGGTTRVVVKNFDVNNALQYISKYKVTYAVMAPIYLHKLIHKHKSTDYDTSNLSFLSVIGAKISSDELKKARKFFPNAAVFSGYGMTEALGYIFNFNIKNDKNLIDSNLESCGKPIPGFMYKIVDDTTGKPVDFYKKGEIRVKSNYLMNEFLNHPDPNAYKNCFDEDDFLCTGDIGYYDEDYCFYIVDRLKNVFKYHNFAQTTTALEEVLLKHPEIVEAVVIATPHPVDGDHASAFVVLAEGCTLNNKDILKYYNEKILDYEPKKLHGGLYILKNIPKTPTGKTKICDLRNILNSTKL